MKKVIALALLALGGAAGDAAAEPYIAAREGFKCVVCHVNPSGGGMRNAFGSIYAQTRLPATALDGSSIAQWAELGRGPIALGGDLRTSATYASVPGGDDASAFSTQELRAYLAVNVIPDRLLLYVDESLAPGALNQEGYARLGFDGGRYYVKAGKMYLPYGLRLQDDSAFVRKVPGINFTSPDHGVELGFEDAQWSTQLALSNGSGGGAENDEGKQESLRVEYVRPQWRAGASANFNDSQAGRRRMANVFAGTRSGSVAWLAEADYIVDDGFGTGRRRLWAGLLEANWLFQQGHNLKLTAEYFDPDVSVAEDQQTRHSLLWEHTPMPFVQLRLGGRLYDGIPQNALQNERLMFIELHAFF